ncbi:exodeoxyribonuclease III [Parvularcula flava]|uniref:Exodeoxyribonuclease III n=1 Tax=Aquisalinus luteolus TaxID=1566827 RepID=A0A8J3ERS0_9PROT|nr:exodeoxyribonuclease III [Aquisalinus luteolus]NHK29013.1 exodeoxyribonuclease III [Aquisalinus luteolus]GGI00579.1 exodeoxyribonuclease III [Aquisalinus luteolus]
MKIASWNVNSINARLPRILEWFDAANPDVCVLQEIKCLDEKFPVAEFEDRGYHCEVHGQKTYNGVALLSKFPVEDVIRGLPGNEDDDQSRYIEAMVFPDNAEPFRVGGLYLPNGNPAPGPKYDYKLGWMGHLKARAEALLETEEAFILTGDYNVIPQAEDVHNPAAWAEDALFLPTTRAAFREIENLGLTDALRHLYPHDVFYTFWDYQRGAWQKDHGIRIDHVMLSPQAADRLTRGGVDRTTRDPGFGSQDAKPSDHVPVWVELD